ncbi:MAG: adenosylmethionine decarboxylase [bacterium]
MKPLATTAPVKRARSPKALHPFDGPVDYLGRQVTVDFFDCDKQALNDAGRMEELLLGAAKAGKATVVKSLFHSFNPYGVSGVVVIAESHLAVHTWPEYGFASVDIFTCGPVVDPRVCQHFLTKALQSPRSEYHEFKRGILGLASPAHKAASVEVGMLEAPAPSPGPPGHRPKAPLRKRRLRTRTGS